MSDADAQLLDRYARVRDQGAFAQLVRRYLNLVYSAAARRVGDPHLAEDITQAIFMILAQKPRAALRSTRLSAWLPRTVHYAAANALKIERRRRRNEAAAAATASPGACSPNPSDVLVWQEIAQYLDDAVPTLPARDRQAILLRYFEGMSMRDIAHAMKLSEGAARQRLSRSIEKLRQRLTRRSATVAMDSAAGLGALLAAHAAAAAPPRLLTSAAAGAATTSGGSALSSTIAKGAMTMMSLNKFKAVAAIVAVSCFLGTGALMTIKSGAHAQAPERPAAQTDARLRDLAAARVRAAEALLTSMEQRERAGDPMTYTFVDLKARVLRQLVDARIDAANDAAGRTGAAQEYLQQCRDMHTILQKRLGQDVSRVQVAQGALELAEAEYLLAKVQAAR